MDGLARPARRLFDRLGQVALVGGGVVVIGSLVAYHAEHPVNPEFATVGDALWWGIVTITTVGYGDIVPMTVTGRWAAVVIMVTGIAVLGVLAGALSSFFRISEGDNHAEPPADEPESTVAALNDAALQGLTAEVSALRLQVEALTRRLIGPPHDQAPGEPPPAQDTSASPGA